MRKIFILLGILVISFSLVACTGGDETVTAPTFTGIKVENVVPVDGVEFVTYYRAKEDTVLVEVTLNNPDKVEIKSVVINGYTYNSSRFSPNSTKDTIYFELNVGSTLGATTYSVDRISYLDGETTNNISGFSGNEFQVFVYKDLPRVERENYTLTKDEISIDFNITDVDDVIEPSTLIAYLYAGETEIDSQVISSGLTTVTFSSLLANKHYEVKVVASYNLNDSNGVLSNVVLYSGTYSTLANGLPSASINNVIVSSNSVDFDISFTDEDDVVTIAGLSVGIYNGDTIVDEVNLTGSTTGVSFENLLNDNNYTIKVLADYDLRDGSGLSTDNVLSVHSFSTLPREIPLPQLMNLNLLENSIEFDVHIDDPNDIIKKDTIIANLYIQGVFIESAEISNYHVDFQVNNLFANQEFKIELVSDYDLNNGLGVQEDEVIFTQVYSTLENSVPSVDIDEIVVSQGYVTLDLSVLDANNTLSSALSAVLYENDTPVKTIVFNPETLELVFDYSTTAGTSYYVEIFADYNLRDEQGIVRNASLRRVVLFTAEPKAPIAEIKNIETTTSGISFEAEIIDADSTINPGSIIVYIYLGDTLIAQDVLANGENNVEFINLLSNNEYTIVIEADYDLVDGSGLLEDQLLISHSVGTDVKEKPTADISDIEITNETISLDVNLVDQDSVIKTDTMFAYLYLDGVEVDNIELLSLDNFDIQFNDLLSNNDYVIKVLVNYNLTDGTGDITDYEVASASVSTYSKEVPVATFQYTESDKESITADIFVKDDDEVIDLISLKAVLMLDGEIVVGVTPVDLDLGLNPGVEFDDLYSNARYYINVVATYNLNDGEPNIVDEVIGYDYIQTDEFDLVTAQILNVTADATTISFDVTVEDPQMVIDSNLQAVLYIDDVAVVAISPLPLIVGENSVTFNGVDSETTYTIQVEADYDLNEATGPVLAQMLDFTMITTEPLAAPSANISNPQPEFHEVTVDIEVTDRDLVIQDNLKAEIYKDDTQVGVLQPLTVGENTITFPGLLANNTYEVRVYTDYDLNNEDPEQLGALLDSFEVTTLAKQVPEFTSANVNLTHTSIVFEYNMNDIDTVLDSNTLQAALIVGAVTYTQIDVTSTTVSFDISYLLANQDFEIEIYADYNLDDGSPAVVGGLIKTFQFTTLSYEAPSAVIDDLDVYQESIDVQITVTDPDSTSSDELVAELFEAGNPVALETIVLVNGVNNIQFSTTISPQVLYKVVVRSHYDLRDGLGEVENQLLATRIFSVHHNLKPEATIENIVVGEESITFDVIFNDAHDTITPLTTNAKIYLDGEIKGTVTLDEEIDNIGKQFLGLRSDRDYEIIITTTYDNGDGLNEIENYVLATTTNTTIAKSEPEVEVVIDTINATELIFDIVFDDDSGITSIRTAKLYDEDDTLQGSFSLDVGDNLNKAFTGLLGSSDYRLEIEVTMNRNDGNLDVVEVISTQVNQTASSSIPTAEVTTLTPTTSSVDVTYTFLDVDSVSTSEWLRVYLDSVFVAEFEITAEGTDLTHKFENLAPNKNYEVVIESTYNLNDLDGLQTDKKIASKLTTTENIITLEQIEANIGKKSNVVDIAFNDYENILNGGQVIANLYQDAALFSSQVIDVEYMSTIDMINLLSNKDYTLEIVANYDYLGGTESTVILSHEFTTSPLSTIDITIEDSSTWEYTGGNLEIDVQIGVDDDDLANDTEWQAWLYVNGVRDILVDIDLDVLVGSNPEGGGAPTTLQFNGYDLVSGNDYTVVIVANTDDNEVVGVGEVETILASRTFIDANN